MVLYRPVGHKELELICNLGLKGFPPRLPEQPIFYPVLNAGYAKEIAKEWNAKSDTFSVMSQDSMWITHTLINFKERW